MSNYNAGYANGYAEGKRAVEVRMAEAASRLSDAAAYKVMRMAGSSHPCPLEDCNLSVEEHHRLMYGVLAENKELKRRVTELENG